MTQVDPVVSDHADDLLLRFPLLTMLSVLLTFLTTIRILVQVLELSMRTLSSDPLLILAFHFQLSKDVPRLTLMLSSIGDA